MKPVTPAAVYVSMVPVLTEAAREVGYALAVHGSMGRDFDVSVMPRTAAPTPLPPPPPPTEPAK